MMYYPNMKILLLLVILLLLPCIGFAAITVDGHIDESEWENAQSFRDFVVIDPLTLAKPPFDTRALLLSTQDGLAVAFICKQPVEGSRTRTVAKRDASQFDADSVSFFVDFDGIGEIAYEFSVNEFYPDDHWTYIATFFYLDDKVDFSDMGYQQRNGFREYFLKASYRRTDLPMDFRAASVTWTGTVKLPRNTDGVRLPGAVSLSRSEKMRNGSDMSVALQLTTNGYDDLISRRNGLVWLDERWSIDALI